MKRATVQWLKLIIRDDMDAFDSPARDALATDAENKRLKKERREIDRLWADLMSERFADNDEESCIPTRLIRALDAALKVKR